MNLWEKIVGGIFIAVAGCVFTWLVGSYFDLNKGEWAAWVQAVGSVAAIVAAAWIAFYQKHQYARESRLQLLRTHGNRARAIFAIAHASYKLVEQIEQAFIRRNIEEYFEEICSLDALSHAQIALRSIPLHELNSYILVEGLIQLADALAAAIKYVEDRLSKKIKLFPEEELVHYVEPFSARARGAFESLRDETMRISDLFLVAKRR